MEKAKKKRGRPRLPDDQLKHPRRKSKSKSISKEKSEVKRGVRSTESIEAQKEDSVKRARKNQETVRNIGRIPPIKNIERRLSCKDSLLQFILTYAMADKMPFSEDHLTVINKMELAIRHGGKYILAVYRSFGKSSITELAVLWCILYGYKFFVPIITATKSRSEECISGLKVLLQLPMIAEDWPEVCFPIQQLEGINQRASAQLYTSVKTEKTLQTSLKLSGSEIILPSVDGALDEHNVYHPNLAAGAKISSCGITSTAIRGMRHFKKCGEDIQVIRPDIAILDDIQSEASAVSMMQINKMLNTIQKAILKTSGHTTSMTVMMPCTVLAQGDLVDQLLDRKMHPSWQGERIAFVKSWSKVHDTMWLETYAKIRNTYDDNDPDDFLRARKEATEYYKANKEVMDEGCVVSWEYCYNETELSAIQHAYNAYIDEGPSVFASEFQNKPLENKLYTDETTNLQLTDIQAKYNNRTDINSSSQKLTSFIDVQGNSLYYMTVAWDGAFGGQVIDYGAFPKQLKQYFTVKEISPTLFDKYTGLGQEGVWYKGLTDLTEYIIGKKYVRSDGVEMSVSRLMIDANDGCATKTVSDFCRTSLHRTIVMPARSIGITAAKKPFSEYSKRRGEKVGEEWRISILKNADYSSRYILSNVNYWKSFVVARIKTSMGEPGCLSFNGSASNSRMLSDHMISEYCVRTAGNGRSVEEWQHKPNTENHLWDCLINCAIAASEQGIQLQNSAIGMTAVKRGRLVNQADRIARLSRLGKVRG